MIEMKRKNTFAFEYENARYEIISFKYEKGSFSKFIRFKYRKTEGQIRRTYWSTHFWLKDENLQTNDIDLLIENVKSDVIGDILNIEDFKASIRNFK